MLKRNFCRAAVCLLLILMTMATPIINVPTAYAATMKVLKCNVSGGRLREGPSTAYDVVSSLKRGEKVLYSGKTKNAFSLVSTADGRVGYVYKGYLSSYGSVRDSQVYYTRTGNMKLYKKPSTKSGTAVRLRKKQFIFVYKKAGNWAYVRTMEGKAGYIPLSNIKKF